MRTYKKFTKEQRSTFPYWFWHWLAFNDVARELHVWKFHHIFHDIEKPFLRLIFPYKKVQKWHRTHNKHHLEYRRPELRNWVDMIIDWEASGRTKYACPRNAFEEANFKLKEGSMSLADYNEFIKVWNELQVDSPFSLRNMVHKPII
jgi:hypothetical protein